MRKAYTSPIEEQLPKIIKLREAGLTHKQLAIRFGVHENTIKRLLRKI